jgi:hypothetical protein
MTDTNEIVMLRAFLKTQTKAYTDNVNVLRKRHAKELENALKKKQSFLDDAEVQYVVKGVTLTIIGLVVMFLFLMFVCQVKFVF